MFGTKIIIVIVIELVAVTIGQVKYGEQGQWLYFAPGKPMVVTGPVITGHEAPVSSCNSAPQSGEPGAVVPVGESTTKENIYNIIILQYDPVSQPGIITQNPSRAPLALTPFLVETQSVREPSSSPPEKVVTQAPPVITTTVKEYGPRHLPRPIKPAPPAVATPQPSTTSKPQPPVTEAASSAPPVVVITQSPPAVTQAPRQIIIDVRGEEANENYTVEAAKAPVPVIDGPSAPAAPPAIVVPSYSPVHHPQPVYTPVHRPLLLPRPIRPAPPTVAPIQPSTISEPQPQVTEAASQAPPEVVSTQSPPEVIQAPRQIVIDVRDKEASKNYTVEASKAPVPVIDGPSAPAAPPAIVVPSYAPVHRPQPVYTPVHRPLLLPRPIRPAPPAVAHPQPSTISEAQPQVTEAAPVAPTVVVVTQSPPAVTQAPRQIVFNGQRNHANGYYHVEAPVVRSRPVYNPVPRTVLLPRPIRPAPPTVATPQPSAFSEPQPRVTEAASPPAVTQEPIQIIIDAQSKNATVEAPKVPAPVVVVPSAPSVIVQSNAPVPHPRLHYIPVHIPLLLPRPIRPAPPTVALSQASSISDAQASESEAVLAPSVVITASPVVIEASEQSKFDFECQQGDGYYSVENECDAYIECKENKAVKYTCLYGLYFNPAAKYIEDLCASSSEVKCVTGDQEQIPVPTTVQPTIEPIVNPKPVHPRLHYIPVHIPLLLPRPIKPAPPTVSPSQPSSISEGQAPETEAVLAPSVVITASPVVIEASEQSKFDFECQQGDGYYSVENECDAYIECKENKAVKFTCLYGLYFNPAAKYIEDLCASSSEVKCVTGDQEQIPVPTTVRPRIEPIAQPEPVTQYPAPTPIVSLGNEPTAQCPAEHGFFPMKNGDCSQYIRCHEFIATIMKCPKGLAFNPQTNICDWPSNVSNCSFIEA